jgi:hypothetical protein
MAARKTTPTGWPKGAKTKPREPLLPTVRRTRPMVVDKSIEIVEYDEVVEADVKAQYLMSCRHPQQWSLNKLRGGGANENADEIAREEAAVRQFRDDVEARSVVALLGLTAASKSAR